MVIKKLEKPSDVEKFIDKGGQVSCDKEPACKLEWTNFTLRIRKDLSEKIDCVIEERIGISKTAWILEAIQEKLNTKL
jgi:predicted HicB family RNase H-like nuclease